MAGGMKRGRTSSARVHACRRSVADSLNRSALYDVGVYAESAVLWLLASAANVRITRSSVPSGFPGRTAADRRGPARADSFLLRPPAPPGLGAQEVQGEFGVGEFGVSPSQYTLREKKKGSVPGFWHFGPRMSRLGRACHAFGARGHCERCGIGQNHCGQNHEEAVPNYSVIK